MRRRRGRSVESSGVATARERAAAELRDHRRLASRQAALLRLSAEIAAAREETAVCESVVEGLHDDDLGYEFVAVFMVDEPTGDRVLRASVGWPDAPEAWRVPHGKGLSEKALLDATLHYSPDVAAETGYVKTFAAGSEVDVPLVIDGKPTGVLVVQSGRVGAFGREDFESLSAAAQQASIAIGRVRLLDGERRRADEQEALLASLADLSAELELSRLLQAVLGRAVGLLGASGGELAIFDEGRRELEIVANHNIGKESTGTRMALGEGAMGRVAQTNEPLNNPVHGIGRRRRKDGSYVDVELAGVPVFVEGQRVGVMAIYHDMTEQLAARKEACLLYTSDAADEEDSVDLG